MDPNAGLLRLRLSRTHRSGTHRNRWWYVDEGLRLLVRAALFGLPHSRSLAYHRIGKRAFERVHTVRFASIVARLKREWKARARAA